MILTVEGTYCSSSGELYDFDLRRHVLSIIRGAIWFWPEKPRTVHHLGSSIMLTWVGTYCPSSGELYEFDLRNSPDDGQYVPSHVKIIELPITSADDGEYMPSSVKFIELPRWWTVRAFSGQHDRAPQMMESTCPLRLKS
jgi:hypothetical protein